MEKQELYGKRTKLRIPIVRNGVKAPNTAWIKLKKEKSARGAEAEIQPSLFVALQRLNLGERDNSNCSHTKKTVLPQF